MWQRFTERARKIIFYAQEEAQALNTGWVSSEHLLLGLLRESPSRACTVLDQLGVSRDRIRQEVENLVKREESGTGNDLTLTPESKRVIDFAYEEARNLNNNFIGTEHILLGLVRLETGIPPKVFKRLKLKHRAVKKAVTAVQEAEGVQKEAKSEIETAFPLSDRAHRATSRIRDAAATIGDGDASSEHLLLGLVSDPEATAARILDRLGITEPNLRAEIERRSAIFRGNLSQMKVLPRVQRVIDLAKEIAEAERAASIGTSHYLLAIIREEDGIGAKALRKLGVDEFKVCAVRNQLRSDESSQS